ncbi:Ribonuclease H-like protein [Dioscorea alata]|uniref:Ribonuclease H-like protein n=1 Tax=Dioscorea alata TaxID=55571 RepID=A0ACB7WTZ9_DIOAL|nr:Ribonuclease H-like protein [Dioscorea alata]
MLEDIGKILRIKKTIERAIFLVGYIYNHTTSLNMLRSFTKKQESVKHGINRFATSFLTLQKIHEQKQHLRCMFTSNNWTQSKMARDPKGKRATGIVLMPSFWNLVVYILKVMGPLVRVLRLLNNEKKLAMGYIYIYIYIYEAMDRAKETLSKSFDKKEDKYKKIFEIIDCRWECQLHHPLHAAGHMLNPEFFYGNPALEFDEEVTNGLYKTIERLVPDLNS